MKPIVNNIIKVSALLSILFMGLSCHSIEKTYEDYLGDAERIYVGKLDSIRVYSGFERVQVQGFMNFARTAKEVVIRWEDQERVQSLEGLNKSDVFKFDIDNLSEGSKLFTIFTRDSKGNKSIDTEIFADVYGPIFMHTLVTRSISSIDMNPDQSLKISWNVPELNVVGVELTYKDNSGNEHTLEIDNKDKFTVIEDWKSGSVIEVSTKVLPKPTDLDVLTLESVSYTLPVRVVPVDTRAFTYVNEPYTSPCSDWGGVKDGLFDHNLETFVHTQNGEGVPTHFSYDMKELQSFVKGRMVGRHNEPSQVWCPTLAEIWGLKDYAEEIPESELASKFPGIDDNYDNRNEWPKAATDKGWVKMCTIVYDSSKNPNEAHFDMNPEISARYIMVRVVKVAGGEGTDKYASMREIDFWKKDE